MASTPVCAGCKNKLPIRENLICVLCKCRYDLECGGVSKDYYTKKMTLENKNTWKCQTCICKIPKTGNTNTPIRIPRDIDCSQISSTPPEEANVTLRKKTINLKNDTICSDDQSILGDTVSLDTIHTEENLKINNTTTQLTIETLSKLIITHLKENNKSIIQELQNTIHTEIYSAITELRQDLDYKTNTLTAQNDQRKQEIENINKKLEKLQTENENLKKEIRKLATETSRVPNIQENNCRKIVLYGFADYYKEHESSLHDRLIELFRDIVNIDVSGYIEDLYRLGRPARPKNRPLVIEFISKRMTKYIINNSGCFQGTGLFVSEFLDANARKHRAQMREKLFQARKNGLHAIIRNNQLYIDGKLINLEKTKLQYDYNTREDDITLNNMNQTCPTNMTNETETENQTFRKQRPTI